MFAASKTSSPASEANYIESVFSTYLYTGNGSTQTITNGIDLSGKGGLVWTKGRTTTDKEHDLRDSARSSFNNYLRSNNTDGQSSSRSGAVTPSATGYSLSSDYYVNSNTVNYASWTFREQAKFFDVVTYTGNGANRTISHNLGSVPGFIIVKRTDAAADWQCYHRSLANTQYMVLNTTAAVATGATRWNSTTPTSTVFSLGTDTTVNASGGTYVAYIYAHDAGGFGLTGTDNVISCGSYTGNGSATGPVINLGYEPQWIMIKNASAVTDWVILDTMRGLVVGGTDRELNPNQSSAESGAVYITPTATGFQLNTTNGAYNASGNTFIYIAIRRGPMKTPTSGTEVFGLSARTGTGANATVTGGTGSDDAVLIKNRGSAVASLFSSRLTGTGYLVTSTTAAEVAAGTTILQANPWDVMDGVKVGTTSTITNASANTFINYLFRRAPGFFDVVCYTGNDVNGRVLSHNLTVKPELVILKTRNSVQSWPTLYDFTGTNGAPNGRVYLNLTDVNSGGALITAANASTITLDAGFNSTPNTYIAYLFATLAGVSKVGSYTGTAALQTVNCGFAAGARFVLIKRTDSTGDWYVWDSARGISSGNDPYILLNSTAAEVTGTNYVDTDTTGFKVTAAAPAALNASGGTYIFLAIA